MSITLNHEHPIFDQVELDQFTEHGFDYTETMERERWDTAAQIDNTSSAPDVEKVLEMNRAIFQRYADWPDQGLADAYSVVTTPPRTIKRRARKTAAAAPEAGAEE